MPIQEPKPRVSTPTKPAHAKYEGPERRRAFRRQKSDRRDMVRWEPEKAERRQGHGRRKEDPIWRKF